MVVMLMSDFDQVVDDFFKNYQDRGMKKWTGFFLSDHTLKINKDIAKRQKVYHKKTTMSEQEISTILLKAFANHYYVKVQLKELDENGNFKKDICGFIEGCSGQKIIISRKAVEIENINNIEVKK